MSKYIQQPSKSSCNDRESETSNVHTLELCVKPYVIQKQRVSPGARTCMKKKTRKVQYVDNT